MHEYYKLILNFKKSITNGKLKVFISGENSNIKPNLKRLVIVLLMLTIIIMKMKFFWEMLRQMKDYLLI